MWLPRVKLGADTAGDVVGGPGGARRAIRLVMERAKANTCETVVGEGSTRVHCNRSDCQLDHETGLASNIGLALFVIGFVAVVVVFVVFVLPALVSGLLTVVVFAILIGGYAGSA